MSTKTTPTAIITSPAYTDLTTNLTKSPTTTTSPTSTKARSKSTSSNSSSTDAYAQKAMNNTSTWQPKLDRRQSWSNEEYKHLMQSRSGSTGGSARLEGQEGFTEEGHTGY
ncbi:hypothetical protein B0T20DRAFT_477809 [Sordaria brevicollis]|uniref:Uncharacterized protein n=1 Tax=Sordaria brevicollis TaxID=83679 RepID=A0AAE0UDC8_SORBR|nr:hypothetical protein B0T20DRAFT_477809 [Sordaria brevicollis]